MNEISKELLKVKRDCDAILIPGGEKVVLVEGTHVRITQALGGDYTVYVNGNLLQVSGKDADAIGMEESKQVDDKSIINNGEYSDELVWEQLKTCYDPEIPVNIVDLGLIYDLSKKGNKNDGYSLNIKMTLTAPGCGMGPSIAQDVDNKINALPGVNDVLVEIIWDPVWDRSMMSEEAKLKLGMF